MTLEIETGGPASAVDPSIEISAHRERSGTEWLTVPGQSYFGVTAVRMRKLGWAVLPQDRDGRRLPSIVAGQRIKWGEYKDEAPSLELTEKWAVHAPSANTAILLGPPSGNMVCLDLDITDADISLHIQEIAEEILGISPFRRVGKRPKIALFYRMPTDELPTNRSYFLTEKSGEKSEHQIEIKSRGAMMTAVGPHHESGQTFRWQDALPQHVGPAAAPLVTTDMLEAFLEAVETRARPFYRSPAAGTDVEFDYVDSDGIDVARIRRAGEFAAWTEDAEGYVGDGREKYVFALAMRTVRANPAACTDDRGVAKLKKAVFEEGSRTIRQTGRWSEGYLKSEVSEKVTRLAALVARGEISPILRECTVVPSDELSKQITSTKKPVPQFDDTFDWLGTSRAALKAGFQPGPEGAAEEWALKVDRSAIHAEVAETIREGLEGFFSDVREQLQGAGIHVIMAPTGSGKTAHALEWIIRDPDTIADDSLPIDQRRGPLLFLMPTYNNIDEVRSRAVAMGLDPDMTDAELEAAATERGLVFEGEVDKEIAGLRGMAVGGPVRTMVYRGKVAAGCRFPEQMQALMDADIGSSGMCKSTIKTSAGEREEVTCEHYATCNAILQRAEIANSHLVFLPRSFLTLTIPEELKKARGVIVDEGIWDLLAHTNTFPIAALYGERKEPTLTKSEREAGTEPAFMLVQRGHIAGAAIEALETGKDPALHIRAKFASNALELVKVAKRVCSSAIQSGQTVRPRMHPQDFLDLVSQPKSVNVKAEFRFWSLVEERLEAIVDDELAGRTPKRDMRIQCIRHDDQNPQVRLSWRTEPNWSEAPLLLLDASADKSILERCFQGRKIRTYGCTNEPNLRTIAFPDRTLAVTKLLGRSGQDELETAKGLLIIRRLLTAICAAHSNGRVAVCTTKPVRAVICTGWVPPMNADFLHDGATAGLDFAKDHVALISLGRTELPITTVDGLVAALTYDMDAPELPIDRFGTGKDSQSKPILPHRVGRKIRMRDGRYAITQHQAHRGEFARAVQKQAREEAIRQRIGRVRGVYRAAPAAVYLVGEAIPDDVVLDDIRSYSDLETGFDIFDTARRIDGILSPEMIPKIAPDQWTCEAASKEIGKLGDRMLRNYRWIRWADERGIEHDAYVPMHHDDMSDERTFVRWAKALSLRGRVTKGSEYVAAVAPSAPRPDDKVEAALGTIEERREQEESFIRRVIEHAMATGEYKPATATPIGKQRARYRIHPDTDQTAEIGELHLMRILAGMRELPEETGIDANLARAESGAIDEGYRQTG
ncbi:bifunctional DNA primase/polymerase [Devosia nitrariae]|uniref:DNA primase/polymerase bifunctional N-terminal domain-containing protein n=1 Tax=Devosia nitrariae TaxID=2071872 RepID=A0ABQ5W1Q0_9HYPH|nr:bifunctional DNA primase/polymerase [Devosia nitrariae]GLQ53590.1 hypothetical protein GCM10010862_08490 [Devosia nitrariae]